MDIKNDLNLLHNSLRESIKKKWDRSLPFADEVFDRWERAKFLGFGENASIYDSSLVLGNVKVGKHTWIGPYTILDGTGGLEIGDYCNISFGAQIYSHNSIKWVLSGGRNFYEKESVKIGNCCYIGPHTVISKGVTIGNHCLIGSHSLVNKDIPDNSIAFGITCKLRGTVKILESGEVELVYFDEP